MSSNLNFNSPFQDHPYNASTSTSTSTPTPTTKRQDGQSNPYLSVSHAPPLVRRRSSHASIFSDVSDLEYMSNDHTTGLLRRTVSNVSNLSAHSYPNTGPTPLRQRLRNLYDQNYGAMLVLLAQVFGSGMNVSARLLEQPGSHGPGMHPFQILFTRQSLTALLCTTYALWTKSIPYFPLGPPDRTVRLLLVARGLFGFFGVFGMYFSLLYLPISEATVLTFLAPILTCYLCSLMLPGETFTRQQQIAGLVSFIGVVFIAQPVTLFNSAASSPAPISDGLDGSIGVTNTTSGVPPTHDPIQPTPSQHMLAIGIAMIGVCGATGAMTSIRAIGTRAHAFISINYFSVWSAIVSLVALIIFPDVSFRLPGNLTEWALLLSLGICGFVLQSLLTMGLAYGGPANVPDSKSTSSASNTTISIHHNNKAAEPDIEMQTPSTSSSSSLTPNSPTSASSSSQATTPSKPQPQHISNPRPKPHPSGNRATSMVYCQMLFALGADKLIFGTTLSLWSWIGSGLILSGAVWVATAKEGPQTKTSQPPPSHRQRNGDDDEEAEIEQRSGSNKSRKWKGRPGGDGNRDDSHLGGMEPGEHQGLLRDDQLQQDEQELELHQRK